MRVHIAPGRRLLADLQVAGHRDHLGQIRRGGEVSPYEALRGEEFDGEAIGLGFLLQVPTVSPETVMSLCEH